jgi:hypothetical protein
VKLPGEGDVQKREHEESNAQPDGYIEKQSFDAAPDVIPTTASHITAAEPA